MLKISYWGKRERRKGDHFCTSRAI